MPRGRCLGCLAALTLGCAGPQRVAPPPTLHEAVRTDSLPLVLSLLDAGASLAAPDSSGRLPLSLAVSLRREAIVAELLAAGADPLAADRDGQTAWDAAMLEGKVAIVELLALDAARAAGAGVAAMRWYAGVRGADSAPPEWSDVLSGELLSLGLMYAALHDRADLIATMRRAREIPNRTGYHALAVAARWHQPQAVRALLGIDVHPDVVSQGSVRATPLYFAALAGDVDAARILLRGGAEVDRAVSGGRRPLNVARELGDTAMVRLLEDAQRR